MGKSRTAIITPERKEYIKQLSGDILSETAQKVPVDLHAIADHFNVIYGYGDFSNEFRAQILFDGSDFFIAVNNLSVQDKNYGMSRFSFAHELGHYLIPEHRKGLMDFHKTLSEFTWDSLDFGFSAEREAEYFAACLLMPEEEMTGYFGIEHFTPAGFMKMRDHFKVSLEALLLRYVDVISVPAAVICTHQKKLAWHHFSSELNGYELHLPDGEHVHEQTLAGSLFAFTGSGSGTANEQSHEIWLKQKHDASVQLNPLCEILYYNAYNCISIIRESENKLV